MFPPQLLLLRGYSQNLAQRHSSDAIAEQETMRNFMAL
jgi:hypothetical protein